MDEELIYPELPEGYVWKKKGECKGEDETQETATEDVDVWAEDADWLDKGLVAWVSASKAPDLFVRNRSTESGKHGTPITVSSYQEGINLIHAQLCLGLIGKGKCLQE